MIQNVLKSNLSSQERITYLEHAYDALTKSSNNLPLQHEVRYHAPGYMCRLKELEYKKNSLQIELNEYLMQALQKGEGPAEPISQELIMKVLNYIDVEVNFIQEVFLRDVGVID